MEPELFAEVSTFEKPTPPRQELWIILGVYSSGYGDDVWSIPSSVRGPWISKEAAMEKAKKLAGGWKHIRIVRIPGEGNEIPGSIRSEEVNPY